MTKQEVLEAIVACKEKLGHVPSRTELTKHCKVSRQQIRRHFGTYTQALKECNLELPKNHMVEMETLFRDWADITRRLKKIPTGVEYEEQSQYSMKPLMQRFGSWRAIPAGLKLYAEERGWTEEWQDVLELVQERENHPRVRGPATVVPLAGVTMMPDRPAYGPLMHPCPMLCAPTNEAGVFFLFAAMAEQLGFAVLHVQTEFPDCEALRVVAPNRQQRVRIEFEYESRNFLLHMHDPKGCDLIVCWEHNWQDCPLEALELRKLFSKQREQETG
ncbi:MAG TPA: hypothetical protein VIB39_20645 [Candidatus Angelobacter sp.]|jgi:hypothetical protein